MIRGVLQFPQWTPSQLSPQLIENQDGEQNNEQNSDEPPDPTHAHHSAHHASIPLHHHGEASSTNPLQHELRFLC